MRRLWPRWEAPPSSLAGPVRARLPAGVLAGRQEAHAEQPQPPAARSSGNPPRPATRQARWRGFPARAAVGAVFILAALVLSSCSARRAEIVPVGKTQRGIASWYGPTFHGKATASGEIFDTYRLTAAHRTLPFGALVEVKNLENGKTVRVRINDRGPFVRGRIIDLTYAAAEEIGMLADGTARVELTVLPFGTLAPDDPVLAGLPRFTVQVGAFGDSARARALAEELRSKYPETVVSDDGAWHRVQVGQFTDRMLADALCDELQKLGFAALIVALH